MSASVVQICNMALTRVGVSRLISDLDEASNEARMCKLFYEPSRDRVLRMYPWPFATQYVSLALVVENPSFGWSYAYRYPSDALMVRRVVTAAGRDSTVRPLFLVGSDDSGRLIYTDEPDASIEYTRLVEDASQFDPMFASALAWLIAAEIAMPLAVKDALRVRALQMFEIETKQAAAAVANESQADDQPEGEMIRARY